MPANANITVKKNDGTTDVTYIAVASAGGDRSPAIWQNQTVGTAFAHRPTVKLMSRENGNGSARRMEGVGTYPTLVVGGDGKTLVADKFVLNVSGVVPLGMPATDLNEAVSQLLNVFAATLIKSSFKEGFAPT